MQNMVILTVIWAPAVEEAFFRLFLLNAFRKVSGRNLDALLGSSFFFMVIHITRYYADPLALTWMFLSSLFMGLLFIATRQLWPAIITHSLGNFVEHSITNTLDSSWGFYGWILLPFLPILIVIGIYTAIILLRNSDIPSARKFPEWLWKPVESTTYRSIAALLGLMIGFFTLLFFFPFSYGVTFYLLAWTGLPWFNPSPTVSLALPSITFIVIFTFSLVFVALLVNIVSTWKSSSNVKIESPLQG